MNRLFKFIYPPRCPFCNAVVSIEKIACDDCSLKVREFNTIKTVLKNTFCVSPFAYKDIYEDAVKNLKFGKNKYYAEPMAYYISVSIRENYNINDIDFVTAVPLSKKQMKIRGFNHAEELGKSVAKLLDKPYRESIAKIKENKYQHTLERKYREDNVKGVFDISDKEINGYNILLIDDVTTTGATLTECSKILIKNKNTVHCATFCKT